VKGKNFWKKIETAKGLGYNVSEFAREIVVNRSTLNYWINKGILPPADVAYHIAIVIGDDLGYLLNDVDPEEETPINKLVHACIHELNDMDKPKLLAVLPVLKSISNSEANIFETPDLLD